MNWEAQMCSAMSRNPNRWKEISDDAVPSIKSGSRSMPHGPWQRLRRTPTHKSSFGTIGLGMWKVPSSLLMVSWIRVIRVVELFFFFSFLLCCHSVPFVALVRPFVYATRWTDGTDSRKMYYIVQLRMVERFTIIYDFRSFDMIFRLEQISSPRSYVRSSVTWFKLLTNAIAIVRLYVQ